MIRRLTLVIPFVPFLVYDYSQAESLKLTTLDAHAQPLACRILVRSESGKCIVPNDAVTLKTGNDVWFMTPGISTLEIPAGKAIIRIERGLEFSRIKRTITIDGPTDRSFVLNRWIDMKDRGYHCGENHLHIDSVRLGPMLAAEGLDFGSSLTWWRGPDPKRPIPDGQGRIRMLEFGGRQIPTSVYDAELEYAWGAAYIQNLREPMPIQAEPGRPNLDYLNHAAQTGAIVHYQGGWSREVLLDALLGFVHTVNICNNNFALHRFQPRSRYSNLLKVDGFPIYPNSDQGMLSMNTDTYYRLLNCGLRLSAGAGSATGVKQAPVGYNRAYVRLDKDATIDDFYEAWKAGRNFVTNGPMLFLSTDSDKRPGDSIEFPKEGGQVQVHVEAISEQPLTSIELVVNGVVSHAFKIDNPKQVIGTRQIKLSAGSWIAARCTVRDELLTAEELAAYEDPNEQSRLRVAPSRLRFAHTSPIYISVGGRPVAVRRSIDEGLEILKKLETFAMQEADPQFRPKFSRALASAREQLRSKLR